MWESGRDSSSVLGRENMASETPSRSHANDPLRLRPFLLGSEYLPAGVILNSHHLFRSLLSQRRGRESAHRVGVPAWLDWVMTKAKEQTEPRAQL